MDEHEYTYVTDDSGTLWRLCAAEFASLINALQTGRDFDFERAGKRVAETTYSLNELRGGIILSRGGRA